MLLRFQHLLAPPVFAGDENKTRIAGQINTIGLVMLASTLVYTVAFPLANPQQAYRLFLAVPLYPLLLGILLLIRRGKVRFAAALIVAGIWVVLIVSAAMSGGIFAPAYGGIIVVVLVAAILLGQTAAFGVAGVSLAIGLWMVCAETTGIEQPLPESTTAASVWLAQAVFFVVAATLLHLATASIRESLSGAQLELAERKRAEEALSRTERRYKELVNNAGDIIYKNTPSGHFTFVNPTATRIMGYPEEELLGKHYLEIIRPDYTEPVAKFYRKQLTGKIPSTYFEFPMIAKDGQTVWIGQNVQLLFDAAHERVLELQAIARDITERKRAEEELRVSEERFRALVENGYDGLTLIDGNGKIQYYSTPNERISGYTVPERIGQDVLVLVHPKDRERMAKNFREMVKTPGAQVTGEYRIPHKDGSWRWVSGTAQNLLTNPSVHAIAVHQHDITERKRAEEELQSRLTELEAINKISTSLRVAQSLNEMLPTLLDETLAVMNTTAGQIAFYDKASDELRVAVARGWWVDTPNAASANDGIAGLVFTRGEPYLAREFRFDPQTSELARAQIPAGWGGAIVPVRAGQELIGVFNVAVQLPREVTPNEVNLLTTLAEIAGNAFHRTRLHQETLRIASELRLAYDDTIEGWSQALDLRDRETEGHTQRVAEMVLQLARVFGMNDEELIHVRRGALLHDIGKMGIPDSILLKPTTLSPQEWETMRLHPVIAYRLLSSIAYLRPALDIPYCHHERWDGTGYPRGLKGDDIPLVGRIFAVVDVWDALRSSRPYRSAWSRGQVIDHIRAQSGKHFDPRIAEVFLKMIIEPDAQNWSDV